MAAFLRIITVIFDGIFLPFAGLNPWYGLIVLSVLTGMLMVTIFSKISNQEKMGRVKNLIKAHFLEIQLYKDDFRLLMSAQKNIIRYNISYLKLAFIPATIMFIPILFILIQLNLRLGYRPLVPGEAVNVRVVLKNRADPMDMSLQLPRGLRLNMPPLRIFPLHEVNWQIKPEKSGEFDLRFRINGKEATRKLVVSGGVIRCYTDYPSNRLEEVFLNPGLSEYFTDDSPFELVRIDYPRRGFGLGLESVPDWLVLFFLVSVTAGLALKKIFKIN